MSKVMAVLVALLFALGAAGIAHATTSLEMADAYPAGGSVALKPYEHYYLHLRYTSETPVHIWAEPYFQGKPADAGSNPSSELPAGSGEALGWFFLDPGAQVDEVRIRAGDGSPDNTHLVLTLPVHVSADASAAATDANRPEWATRLGEQQDAAINAAYTKAGNAPVSAGDVAFFSGFMLAMFAIGLVGFAAPAWGLWRWRGSWRWAAAVPAAIMAYVVARLLIETSIDPTSHNLWPFEILMFGALSVAIMLGLTLMRKVTGARP